MRKLALAILVSLVLLLPAVGAGTIAPQSAASGELGGAKQQFEAGEYPGAIQTLHALESQNPTDAEPHYWLGRCFYETKDFNSAVAELEKAAQADPKSSLYHQWLGRAYGEKADRDKSFLTARKVKKEDRKSVV